MINRRRSSDKGVALGVFLFLYRPCSAFSIGNKAGVIPIPYMHGRTCKESVDLQSTMLCVSNNKTGEDEGYNELQMALQRAYERDMGIMNDDDHYDSSSVSTHQPATHWFLSDDIDNSGLPFDCTSCGKCCKTKGTVFMSPDEVDAASNLLELSLDEFTQKYATQKAPSATRKDRFWLQIKNRNERVGGGCIFLDANNLCSIYDARPVQCSTYPFWSSVLEDTKTWDAEVRKADNSDKGPYWTASDGGCEGMKYLHDDEHGIEDGVNGDDAFRRLKDYERWKIAFHSSGELQPVESQSSAHLHKMPVFNCHNQ